MDEDAFHLCSLWQYNLALAMMKKIEDDDDQWATSKAACKKTVCEYKSNNAIESGGAIQPVADVESTEIQSVADGESMETGASAWTFCIECKQTPTTAEKIPHTPTPALNEPNDVKKPPAGTTATTSVITTSTNTSDNANNPPKPTMRGLVSLSKTECQLGQGANQLEIAWSTK
jgi:hypothetical protein